MGIIIGVFYIIGMIYSCILFVDYEHEGLVKIPNVRVPSLLVIGMLFAAFSWISVVVITILANARKVLNVDDE